MVKLLRWVNIMLVLATFLVYLSPFVPPKTFWPLVFPGLFFPWLLLGNVLFFLYWLFRRDRYVFFSLGVLVMGFGHIQRIVGVPFGKSVSSNDEAITVVSFNMHRLVPFRSGSTPKSPDDLVTLLDKYNPDIICLQEVPPRGKDQKAIAQAFAKKLDMPYASMSASKSLGIISRYPLSDTKYDYFTNNVNGILWGTVATPRGDLRVYSYHLLSNQISDLAEQVTDQPPGANSETFRTVRSMLAGYKNAAIVRSDQAQKINQQVRDQSLPFLLCGDLNDVPQSHTYRMMSRNVKDAFMANGRGLGISYAGRLPGLRIDYIFTSKEVEVKTNFIGGETYSDHYPVVASIKF